MQRAEEAGVDAMREALPHARDNRLPPDLEFAVLKRVAVNNANLYLDVGNTLDLDPHDQPSSMLFWGSLANARHQAEVLKAKDAFSQEHTDLLENGISALKDAAFARQALPPAVPGARRDQGPFECNEDHLEHGLQSFGGLHINIAVEHALSEASQADYCDRCLVATQIGQAATVLIAGARGEGMNDAEIMTVISDLIAHDFEQADAGMPVLHAGIKTGPIQ